MLKKIITLTTVFLFCAGMATAADQIRQKDRIRTPKRDGSCGISLNRDASGQLMAANQIRTRNPQRDRLRDGSCRS